MSTELILWTIYDHPRDWPAFFVVRRWKATGDGSPAPIDPAALCLTLAQARECVPPWLYNLGRDPSDDERIVETWI
jgi:hypothetical protein